MIESAMKLPSGMVEASSLVIVKVCVGYVFSEYRQCRFIRLSNPQLLVLNVDTKRVTALNCNAL